MTSTTVSTPWGRLLDRLEYDRDVLQSCRLTAMVTGGDVARILARKWQRDRAGDALHLAVNHVALAGWVEFAEIAFG